MCPQFDPGSRHHIRKAPNFVRGFFYVYVLLMHLDQRAERYRPVYVFFVESLNESDITVKSKAEPTHEVMR